MAQTERTTADIQTLLADNSVGAISPQDMRDAIATAMGGYASMILTEAGGPATKSDVSTTALVLTEYDLRTAQSIDDNLLGCSADITTGEVTIGQTGIYSVSFSTSFTIEANNLTSHFHLFRNDVDVGLHMLRFVSQGARPGALSFDWLQACTLGDTLDVRVHLGSGTADMDFYALALRVNRVG